MCQETADISCKETGSEILALLHESSEIKHFYPKFNRAQRRSGEAFGLFSYKDQKGTLHLAFDRLKLVPNPILKFYSMMECKRILEKMCDQFELCPKFCHLETKANTCFHFQIKKCRGICCGKEALENYNKRVHKALQPFILQTKDLVLKEQAQSLYLGGVRLRAIRRILGVHHKTVSRWLVQAAGQLPVNQPITKACSFIEVDELCSFVAEK
mgnify:CR=1 FL=1